jgi:hypothetical protein
MLASRTFTCLLPLSAGGIGLGTAAHLAYVSITGICHDRLLWICRIYCCAQYMAVLIALWPSISVVGRAISNAASWCARPAGRTHALPQLRIIICKHVTPSV